MIVFPEEVYAEMISFVSGEMPEEACGIIAGEQRGDVRTVRKIYHLENMCHSSERYFINPREQLEAVRDIRRCAMVPLGSFHSHPESAPYPSREDIRLAADADASYVIISLLKAEEAEVKAFRIKEADVFEEKLVIEQRGRLI